MRNSILTTTLKRGRKEAVFLCIFLSAVTVSTQSQTLPLDFVINNSRVGTIQAQLSTSENEGILLSKEELLASLQDELVDVTMNALVDDSFEKEWVPLNTLRNVGLEADFRENDLSIIVTVHIALTPEK